MKRRATQLVLTVGLLLGGVAGLAVVRGFVATDFFRVTRHQSPSPGENRQAQLTLITSHHICAIALFRFRDRSSGPDVFIAQQGAGALDVTHETSPPRRFVILAGGDGSFWLRLGFQAWRGALPATTMPWGIHEMSERGVVAPTWFVALLAAAMTFVPARSLRRVRRLRLRRAAGQCLACGYDLRGAEHERCPECGRAVVTPVRV